MLENIIRSNQQQSRAEQANAQHGLHRQNTGRCSVLQSVFYVMVFVSTHIAVNAHPHFTALRCGVQSLQASTQNKNPHHKKLPEATLT
jgi:hypothetical protein